MRNYKYIGALLSIMLLFTATFGLTACGNNGNNGNNSSSNSSFDEPLDNPRIQTFSERTAMKFASGTTFKYYTNNFRDGDGSTEYNFIKCGNPVACSISYYKATASKFITRKNFIWGQVGLLDGGGTTEYMQHDNAIINLYELSGFKKDFVFEKQNFRKVRTDKMNMVYIEDSYRYFWYYGDAVSGNALCTVKGEFYDVYYNDTKVFTFGLMERNKYDDECVEVLYTRLITGAKMCVGTDWEVCA